MGHTVEPDAASPCADPERHKTAYSRCMCRRLAGANRMPSWVRKFKFCVSSQVCQTSPIDEVHAKAVCRVKMGDPPLVEYEPLL